ncbi:hypothetical protein SCLCIDRAFT_1210787 [Scleroderma citrinum Foug A]|uniref:Uncharacterized protein n=1 Tax=Scleroderma citrinum Foug A TaxID=1036808 RepID=A0A0C3AP53_9AGAM|nr:hypothetical protein SCLCIDRAFT_1210787 [Scleroderma citrinum Foug A]
MNLSPPLVYLHLPRLQLSYVPGKPASWYSRCIWCAHSMCYCGDIVMCGWRGWRDR